MKQSDIFTIIAVALVGIIVSTVLFNMSLGNPDEKSVSFKTVEVVMAELDNPDPEGFNPEAINPTVEVYVGDCVDQDQNGVLDEAELIACGRADAPAEGETSESFEPESESEEGETSEAFEPESESEEE